MMTDEQAKADDATWFKKHGGRRKRVRRAFDCERAMDNRTTVIVVTQLEPGMRTRRGVCVGEDLIEYVLEHGEDCICFDKDGSPYIILEPFPVR